MIWGWAAFTAATLGGTRPAGSRLDTLQWTETRSLGVARVVTTVSGSYQPPERRVGPSAQGVRVPLLIEGMQLACLVHDNPSFRCPEACHRHGRRHPGEVCVGTGRRREPRVVDTSDTGSTCAFVPSGLRAESGVGRGLTTCPAGPSAPQAVFRECGVGPDAGGSRRTGPLVLAGSLPPGGETPGSAPSARRKRRTQRKPALSPSLSLRWSPGLRPRGVP